MCVSAVYLGVTNLSSYQVKMTSLCVQWQLHRHASAYRVHIESLLSEYTCTAARSLTHFTVFTVRSRRVALHTHPEHKCVCEILFF